MSKFSRQLAERHSRTFGTMNPQLYGALSRIGGAFLILFGLGLITRIIRK